MRQIMISWRSVLLGLGLGLVVMGVGIYWNYRKATSAKLSVDEILKEHLQTRFDEVERSPRELLLVRDRIITFNRVKRGEDRNHLVLPYVDFGLLKDDEVVLNSERSNKIVYTDFHVKEATKDVAAHKIAWFIESPKGHGKGYKFLRQKKKSEAI